MNRAHTKVKNVQQWSERKLYLVKNIVSRKPHDECIYVKIGVILLSMTGFFMSQFSFTYIISFGCAKKNCKCANLAYICLSRHGWFDVCFAKFCASEILQQSLGSYQTADLKSRASSGADRRKIYYICVCGVQTKYGTKIRTLNASACEFFFCFCKKILQ